MNLFDFWWIYMYYIDNSHKDIVALQVLLILIVVGICGYRMIKISRRDALQPEVS